LATGDRDLLVVEAMSDEAISTSEIEGELLNRESVQSSIRRQLGLAADQRRVQPAEHGISEMMVSLYREFAAPLDAATLFAWHRMITNGRNDLRDIGRYRTHAEAMQVVSGRAYEPTVHFEAPPSERVPEEMDVFIAWFNRTAPEGSEPLGVVARAALSHIYFESIHPFEDGNGRIGRAIAEKVVAQSLGQPSLTAIGATILAHRAEYYHALEAANKDTRITKWMAWFGGVALEAQLRTLAQVEFVIDKAKLLDQFRDRVNERQKAVLLRMLREGPSGFKGGLSAGNYMAIARTSAATAGRDLAELVSMGVFRRTGEKKYTRYHLPFPPQVVPRVAIEMDGTVVRQTADW
jgi:Fic family protein